MDARLSIATTVPAPARTVTYRGSIAHLNGQTAKVVGFSPVTERYSLILPNGDRLDNVRRQSFIG